MRRLLITAVLTAFVASSLPLSALAQQQRPDSGQDEEAEAAKRKKRDEEWGDNRAPLPALRNAGPCPFVKTLYDAARYVEFKDNREASSNVVWSGEIQGVSAGCQYKNAEPIKVTMEVLFQLGRGALAQGSSKTFRYWIAVTDRNRSILTRQDFNLPITFKDGEDRAYVRETIGEVTIPRAQATTSGANFEILIGFDVTPEMAAFNRDGKRFRLNAGTTAQAPGAPPAP